MQNTVENKKNQNKYNKTRYISLFFIVFLSSMIFILIDYIKYFTLSYYIVFYAVAITVSAILSMELNRTGENHSQRNLKTILGTSILTTSFIIVIFVGLSLLLLNRNVTSIKELMIVSTIILMLVYFLSFIVHQTRKIPGRKYQFELELTEKFQGISNLTNTKIKIYSSAFNYGICSKYNKHNNSCDIMVSSLLADSMNVEELRSIITQQVGLTKYQRPDKILYAMPLFLYSYTVGYLTCLILPAGTIYTYTGIALAAFLLVSFFFILKKMVNFIGKTEIKADEYTLKVLNNPEALLKGLTIILQQYQYLNNPAKTKLLKLRIAKLENRKESTGT